MATKGFLEIPDEDICISPSTKRVVETAVANEDIEFGDVVHFNSALAYGNLETASSGDGDLLGVALDDSFTSDLDNQSNFVTGDVVPVVLEGYCRVTASEEIDVGDLVAAASDGKVKPVTYSTTTDDDLDVIDEKPDEVLGIAVTDDATQDGDELIVAVSQGGW